MPVSDRRCRAAPRAIGDTMSSWETSTLWDIGARVRGTWEMPAAGTWLPRAAVAEAPALDAVTRAPGLTPVSSLIARSLPALATCRLKINYVNYVIGREWYPARHAH